MAVVKSESDDCKVRSLDREILCLVRIDECRHERDNRALLARRHFVKLLAHGQLPRRGISYCVMERVGLDL